MKSAAALVAACVVGAQASSAELVDYEIVDGISIPEPLTGEPGDPERGREVVTHRQQGNCLACHEIPALAEQPFHGDVGPSLAGVANRLGEGELRLLIVDPKVVYPETIMPAFYKVEGLNRVMPKFEGKPILSAEQVEDVIAFLMTLEDEGQTLSTRSHIPVPDQLVTVAVPPGIGLPEIFSGREFATEATRAMQADDFANPGFLWVEQGEALWAEVDGAEGRSCADCHDRAEESMKGVGATYPKVAQGVDKPLNLEQRINLCRTEQMRAEPWPWESPELLAMTTYVKHQSHGMPVNVSIDGPAAPFFERGKELYHRRRGAMDMACKHCHTDHYGQHLRTNLLTQGQSNGFPMYRLFAQTLISLHWFVSDICYALVRAAPPDLGADDLVNLELYLAWRGQGLPVETPAVRQ